MSDTHTDGTEQKAIAFEYLRTFRENNPGKPITQSSFERVLRKADRSLNNNV